MVSGGYEALARPALIPEYSLAAGKLTADSRPPVPSYGTKKGRETMHVWNPCVAIRVQKEGYWKPEKSDFHLSQRG